MLHCKQGDFSHPRPDFYIPRREFNIEAVVASHAHDSEPEYRHQSAGQLRDTDLNQSNRETMLRLAGSLTAKHRKYLADYANLPHVRGRPFVVAIQGYDKPFSYLSAQRAIEASRQCCWITMWTKIPTALRVGPREASTARH